MPTNDTPKRKPNRAPELALTVQYGTRSAPLPSRARFGKWIRAALSKSARLTLRVIGTREARLLNHHYRGRDYATNVLTFIYSDRRPVEGDIAICAPVVSREARLRGISREAHFAHLTVHGVLHLQGRDHERPDEARRMERLEIRILAGLGYDDPYKEKTGRLSRKAAQTRARAPRLTTRTPPRHGR